MHLLHNVSFVKLLTSFVMNSKLSISCISALMFFEGYQNFIWLKLHGKNSLKTGNIYSQKLTLCIAAAAVAQYATYLCILSQKWQNCTLGKHSSELVRYEHMYSRVHDHLTCVFIFSPGKSRTVQCPEWPKKRQ